MIFRGSDDATIIPACHREFENYVERKHGAPTTRRVGVFEARGAAFARPAVNEHSKPNRTMNPPTHLDRALAWLESQGLAIAAIVIVATLVLLGARWLNRALFARLFKDKAAEDSHKLGRAAAVAVDWVIALVILAVAVILILNQVGVNTELVFQMAVAWVLSNGVGILLIVALTFVGFKAAGFLSERMIALARRGQLDEETLKRAHTLGTVIRWLLQTGILLVAAVMILGQLGVQIGPVIAAAGVVGLAVGFGAQSLVQDVISGFFLLLEDQIRVGDVAMLDGKGGYVEKITLRMTILRDFDGSVHYVRNGKIDVVTNMTKDFSFYVFDLGVAYREDVDEVTRVIEGIGAELQTDPNFKDDILAPVEVVGLDKFADSAVMIKARIKTKPIKQWRVGREFNRRLKKKFDELNIEIPFPHMTIYPGKDKKGDSPTLKLEVQGRGDQATL